MQENLFPAYFNDCPIVYVSGRTFPITTHYIEEVHKVVAQGQRLTAMERGKCMCMWSVFYLVLLLLFAWYR